MRRPSLIACEHNIGGGALQGDPLAPKQRDDLERLMTPDQVAKARGLAAAWKSTNGQKQAENEKK